MADIGKFEKHRVVAATMKLTKSGDGLSNALKLDPVALPIGAEVHFAGTGRVSGVTMIPSKDDSDDRVRVHVVATEEIALVAEEDIGHLLGRERDRLRLMREELDGVSHLNFDPAVLDVDGPSEDLIRQNLGSP